MQPRLKDLLIKEIQPNLKEKFESFGLFTEEINGHSLSEIYNTILDIKKNSS